MNNFRKFVKDNLAVGFLLFALFLGAGNIIFPPLLGQQAGENFIPAIIGFLITGVGLPLMGIVAVAKNGGDLQRNLQPHSSMVWHYFHIYCLFIHWAVLCDSSYRSGDISNRHRSVFIQ